MPGGSPPTHGQSNTAENAKGYCWKNYEAGKRQSPEDLDPWAESTYINFCADIKAVAPKLRVLQSLGLSYLTLGEATPSLTGIEAQRLKLASEIGRAQTDSIFVFDEPTIGLHPLDVQTLLGVFRTLIGHGATVVVIEHDLDVIRSADYLIDIGPGDSEDGGTVVACGTPGEVRRCAESVTGRYI